MTGTALGIDIGGTFTDLVLYDDTTGVAHSHKELTTPDDPASGVITGLRHLFTRDRLNVSDVARVVHATTLFTNALIERRGACTGLITTAGFRDILEIGHERKYELYDIFIQQPRPLVPRPLRAEVPERLAPDGTVEIPLDTAALIASAETLLAAGMASLAIVFLHSYADPVHERLARKILAQRFPDLPISLSADISPQIREVERTSTTVANAYIQPLADRYLARLGDELGKLGITADLFLMLSNGGLTTVAEARRRPIEMLESGPAAGALAAAYFSARSKVADVLAFDMGGTTAKLSVVDNGQPRIAHGFEAARERRFIPGSGLPITISTIELIEIGAGGGSIAHLDPLGLLKVGPESAGSLPGPACYTRGGTNPTVTDANLVLGYLDPSSFAGGTIRISREAAVASLTPLAEAAGLPLLRLAWGIHDIVNESMAGAARVHIAEHGQDPRRYALLTTGGGGPLHGCAVAEKLDIDGIVCPPAAGVASAIGLLVAPARIDRVATIARALDAIDFTHLEQDFRALENDALQAIAGVGLARAATTLTRFADLRYIGQGFELVLELPPVLSRATILERFESEYRAVFARTPPQSSTEIINIRVTAQGAIGQGLRPTPPRGRSLQDTLKGTRPAYFAGAMHPTPVYDRQKLAPATEIVGPALIEEPESTLVLPPDARAITEANGNIAVRQPNAVSPRRGNAK